MRATLFLLLVALSSCLSQDDLGQFSSSELNLLLASDSIKFWNLTDRRVNGETVIQECELDDLLAMTRSFTTPDTAKVVFSTGPIKCPGQSDSIIFSGYWLVLDTTNAQLMEFVIDGDSSLVSIDFISSQLLQLSLMDEDNLVQEDYVQK